ncbi:gamma-glutamylcyclotransferase [Pseudohoeflea coraliihabitans]|uniref:Gamma-glutamylcyclotransferase n=1 Tax=Pseudohoeflea coraliihabitans TaxID=2860393 RepID=A0ABS6WQW7_9HYPH|nr:gamma-glutamylcyclotransferase [Pseudohoeflea sp. DP4N28-3]MBW3098043.1 gamma-glutamylcyclotransferase [Pseudohoeflea sp. DP4N28-3]
MTTSLDMTDAPRGDPEARIAYFGYGSLVNRATLRTQIVAAYPARVTGWQRLWRPRPAQAPKYAGVGPAVLTAEAAADAAMDGMLIIDRLASLPSVDARENLYRRVALPREALAFEGPAPAHLPDALYIYERGYEPEKDASRSPILRSYLDAVLQGFHQVFGADGVERFMAETQGFAGHAIHEDRDTPLYPRAVRLADGEADLFARVLAEHGLGSQA